MQGTTIRNSLLAFLCCTVLLAALTSAAPSYSDYDSNSVRDLLEFLMQRENAMLDTHQVVRKQSRGPQLRLRFGKRAENGLSPISAYMMADDN